MSTTTTPETPETELTPELIDRVKKLSPADREKLAWLIIRSSHPELHPEMFKSVAEVNEYLDVKPGAIVGSS